MKSVYVLYHQDILEVLDDLIVVVISIIVTPMEADTETEIGLKNTYSK